MAKDYKYKEYHKNPRNLSKKQDADLRRWLREFGDLSGVVHNIETDELIGGNQRSRIINIQDCEIELSVEYKEPTKQGTVALGYINWQGERYAYRRVKWNEKQAEQANIIANKAGGSWDFDVLANEFEQADLLEWGFDSFELGNNKDSSKIKVDGNEEDLNIDIEFANQLKIGSKYIVIVFEEDEYEQAVKEIGLKRKMENVFDKKELNATGIESVIPYSKIKALIK